jgi:hypothetical protein
VPALHPIAAISWTTRVVAETPGSEDKPTSSGNFRNIMAAKRHYPRPKPDPNRPWAELTPAERNAHYTKALYAYTQGTGPNPGTQGEFFRTKESAAEAPV